MFNFAWRSLRRDRLRFLITVSGVALAVLLILVMNGLFASSSRQITAYIDRSGADLFVAQAGVRNMHMASSVLSGSTVSQVRGVAGVARADAISYFPAVFEWQGKSDSLYTIGLAPDAELGGPWRMKAGQDRPGPGEIIISDRQRGADTPRIGAKVKLGGRELTVVGLSRETKSLASSLAFIHSADAGAIFGTGAARVNYLLVRLQPGADAAQVAAAIERQVSGVTVLTRQALSSSDRSVALQMGVEILGIMATVGFTIGLAVVALTIYVATVEQLRQYGVLKALGAGPRQLFMAILGQGLSAAVLGFGLGVALTWAVAFVLPAAAPGLEIDIPTGYALQVFGLVVLMGLISALAPFWRVQRLDPMQVFRA